MKRKVRLAVLGIGILFLLADTKYRFIKAGLDRWAIRRVQFLVQESEEFKNRWLGVGVIQYPSDLMAYSDLICQIRPEVIIETGTNYGGLAVFFATLLEKVNPKGTVITVDISSEKWLGTTTSGTVNPELLAKIVFIQGDSVSEATIEKIRKLAGDKKGLVILDSLHTREHVLKEMKLYSRFVAPNSYLIVNDTHLEIMGIAEHGSGNGPLTAVRQFLESNSQFAIDLEYPRSVISCAPSGFLKRIK